MKIYKTAQTNGEAWHAIDAANIAVMNTVFRLAYPTYNLKDYADPDTEPVLPADGDTYLVDADANVWGLNVTARQLITWITNAWTVLPVTIDAINSIITTLFGGFYELELAGTDGDFVDGERTGIVKDFELPAGANLTKSMIVFDGLNFTKDYTKEVVAGLKYIRFTNAPLANSWVHYQL